MVEAPATLTDDELDMIMRNDELRDIYEMTVTISQAYSSVPEPDMTKEWKLFQRNIKPKAMQLHRILKIAAIITGIALLSAAAIMGINSILSTEDTPKYADIEQPAETDNSIGTTPNQIEKTNSEETNPIQHKPVKNLPGIKQYLAQNHTPESQKAKTESEDIDIDEYLRIQQARVDNDIAMQTAIAYQEEFATLRPLLDELGINSSEMDLALGSITMQ